MIKVTYTIFRYEIRAIKSGFIIQAYESPNSVVAAYINFWDLDPLPKDELVQIDPSAPLVINANRPLNHLSAYIDILRNEKKPIVIKAFQNGQEPAIVYFGNVQQKDDND